MIQMGKEQLRHKRIFIYFSYCVFTFLLGAIFVTNVTINPPLKMTSAVI